MTTEPASEGSVGTSMSVSSDLWQHVVDRDASQLWWHYSKAGEPIGPYSYWRLKTPVICLVPMLDPDNPHPCKGKQEVDHVKDNLMMGRRAPDDEYHLVAMCQNHNTWYPPRKELRQAERAYLRSCRSTHSNTASSA